MMAVFMDQVIEQIKLVSLKQVDKGQARSMTITEAHDAGCT